MIKSWKNNGITGKQMAQQWKSRQNNVKLPSYGKIKVEQCPNNVNIMAQQVSNRKSQQPKEKSNGKQ